MKKIFSMAILLSLFFIALSAQDLRAKTYFVSQSGDGDGTGWNYENSMSVSSHNSGSFSPGDTIYLCDTITSPINVPGSGTAGNVITYKGNLPDHVANLDMTYENIAISTKGKDYLTFDNIEISDAKEGIGNNSGGSVSDHITVTNCTIHGCTNRGILGKDWTNAIVGGSEGNGNTIYNCGVGTAGTDVGFNANSFNNVISYNKLYGNGVNQGVDGVVTEGATNITIEYNLIYDHWREDGIDIKKGSSGIVIRYNDIYGHTRAESAGIRIQSGSNDVQIYGNRIHDNGRAGISIVRGADYNATDMTNIKIMSNQIYKNSTGVHVSAGNSAGSPNTITGVLIYDNTFAENGDKTTNHMGGVHLAFGSNHEVKNNFFYKNTDDTDGFMPYVQVYLDHSVTDATFDDNIYYYPGVSGEDMFNIDGTPRNLTEWKTQGYDPNSTEEDEFKKPEEDGFTPTLQKPEGFRVKAGVKSEL